MTPLEGPRPPSATMSTAGVTRMSASSEKRRKRKRRVLANTSRQRTDATSYPQGNRAATCSPKSQ